MNLSSLFETELDEDIRSELQKTIGVGDKAVFELRAFMTQVMRHLSGVEALLASEPSLGEEE